MADNENFENDDTYEEIDTSYSVMEENEDGEGTVEYLDLDMEIENFQEYCPNVISTVATKPAVVQSSVLKANHKPAEPKPAAKSKPVRTKPARTIPERSIMRTRSSTGKSATRGNAKRTADCLAPPSVHDAVNSINAKLADTVKSVNGRETKKASTKNGGVSASDVNSVVTESTEVEKISEMDGLDLFFQSMAQTVLNLPSQVQAKIKMDICKVIATAEIKYRSSDNVQGVGSLTLERKY